ncbi:MAG TPA: J domain-containing protein, partial [Sphingomicrobium sp.]|nr:J domain-containing protein [Sphingomicrobium sp.]
MAWNLGVPYGIGVLGASVHTYYDILNVSRSSEEVVIRAAYRALIAKYHPDRFRGDAAEADRMAKLINEAYAVLSDPHR